MFDEYKPKIALEKTGSNGVERNYVVGTNKLDLRIVS